METLEKLVLLVYLIMLGGVMYIVLPLTGLWLVVRVVKSAWKDQPTRIADSEKL